MNFTIQSIGNALSHGTQERRRLGAAYISQDTVHRECMRALLEGAAAVNAHVDLAFLKKDDSIRIMRAAPCVGTDATACYMTVRDLDLSAEHGRDIYRRVRLDTIVSARVRYDA